jgi:hypothetical protein
MNPAKNHQPAWDGLKLGLAGLTVSPWGAPFFTKAATEEKMTIAIMKEMVKNVPDAGSYAPVTVLSMNVPTACPSPMTKWRVTCFLTATRMLLPSPEILIQKLQPCYANARAEIGQKFSARLSLR